MLAKIFRIIEEKDHMKWIVSKWIKKKAAKSSQFVKGLSLSFS